MKHGQGVLFFPNGDSYQGGWLNDQRDGNGTLNENGAVYMGQWKGGVRHGIGKEVWADGNSYEGEYINNLKHGIGTFHSSVGRFEGEWFEDAMVKGAYHFVDGDVYDGSFMDNAMHGEGRLVRADG